MNTNLGLLLLLGACVGAAAGYIGSFMVLKRMSLVGDALSHVALPGMAIGLIFHVNPIWGALVALTAAVIGIWYFQKTTTVYPEALVGLFFTASLAIGILITPEPELLEALFGSIEKINFPEAILAVALSAVIIIIAHLVSKKLMLGIISEDLAKSAAVKTSAANLIFYLLVGLVVALGIKFIGTLLMGALVIVPAVSAKNLNPSLSKYYLFSIIFGILSALGGILTANLLNLPPGPIVVLTSIVFFLSSYGYRLMTE